MDVPSSPAGGRARCENSKSWPTGCLQQPPVSPARRRRCIHGIQFGSSCPANPHQARHRDLAVFTQPAIDVVSLGLLPDRRWIIVAQAGRGGRRVPHDGGAPREARGRATGTRAAPRSPPRLLVWRGWSSAVVCGGDRVGVVTPSRGRGLAASGTWPATGFPLIIPASRRSPVPYPCRARPLPAAVPREGPRR